MLSKARGIELDSRASRATPSANGDLRGAGHGAGSDFKGGERVKFALCAMNIQ